MHNFLVCSYKSQDFAQSQKFFARSHDHETVTFRISVSDPLGGKSVIHLVTVQYCSEQSHRGKEGTQ